MLDLSYIIQDMTDTITRTNPFSGVSVELTMEEAVRYDQIKEDEVNENYGRMQSGLTWFQKNNVDAYYKLLDYLSYPWPYGPGVPNQIPI